MPEVVLRNSATGAPFVFPAGPDGVVPFEFKAAGWEIDSATDPAAAREELAERSESAARAAAGQSVTPSFAPDPAGPVAAPVVAPRQPAPSPTPAESSVSPADTNLEI